MLFYFKWVSVVIIVKLREVKQEKTVEQSV